MKHARMVLLAITLAAAGCRESDEGRLADDDTIPMPAAAADSRFGPGPGPGSRGMGHGAMMSGNMQMDMEGMNRMMLDHLGPADSTYDARFIHIMVPHHEGAVMMATDALDKAVHPELRVLAQGIITSQKKEIDRMKSWMTAWYPAAAGGGMPGGDSGIGRMLGMNRRMVEGLGAKDSAYDKRFIDMMIPHHQGGVDMARDAEAKAVHRELKDLARSIAADQEREIARMTEWREKWYGE